MSHSRWDGDKDDDLRPGSMLQLRLMEAEKPSRASANLGEYLGRYVPTLHYLPGKYFSRYVPRA